MKRAQTRDAVHREKFYFCKDTFPTQQRATTPSHSLPDSEVTEMDLNTIFNGSVSERLPPLTIVSLIPKLPLP